ncbi:MAG: stage 0 sporulation protein [Firmicutes bacterium HGW-Firmicutes-3]|nr:MAG: stage 0 sporulation protein [Firmicutes bacterium HGW-Firmicutes-3]
MIKVVGVRFRKAGKIYYFDPATFDIKPGQCVIVETVRGIEYGHVVLGNREIEENDVIQPLKKVIRMATTEDDQTEVDNKIKEREAYEVCNKKIRKHSLDMKLIDCEYTFDNNKLLFYFTADGRIDFRELVKDLAAVFKTRIELRQIGVRDETKMIGSIGICGLALCCHSFLTDFHPVSIKMAKEQNLSLNPTKISGVCGRLMCCLKYEEETYEHLNKNLPSYGDIVKVKETGLMGEVINTNIIRQLVKIVIRRPDGDPEIVQLKIEDLLIQKPNRKKGQTQITKEEEEELKRLEALEREEKKKEQENPEDHKQKHEMKHEQKQRPKRNKPQNKGKRVNNPQKKPQEDKKKS